MVEIPIFEEAANDLRRLLRRLGHTDKLCWVFRDDLWLLSPSRGYIRLPLPDCNEVLAQAAYAQGVERGLVRVLAVGEIAGKVAATVWFPKNREEEVQGWDRGLKVSVQTPLVKLAGMGSVLWALVSSLPAFRRYQRLCMSIGTRAWAGA